MDKWINTLISGCIILFLLAVVGIGMLHPMIKPTIIEGGDMTFSLGGVIIMMVFFIFLVIFSSVIVSERFTINKKLISKKHKQIIK